jgi:hypothetical protein
MDTTANVNLLSIVVTQVSAASTGAGADVVQSVIIGVPSVGSDARGRRADQDDRGHRQHLDRLPRARQPLLDRCFVT